MNQWRQRAVRGIKAGDVSLETRTFSQEDMEAFGRVTGDYNPVHYDPRFTAQKGMDGLICHGLLIASMVSRFGGQVAWLASGMDFKFLKPVYPGDSITCRIEILEVDDRLRAKAAAWMHNQDGVKVMEGTFSGVLPNEAERGLLARMLQEGDPTNGLA